MSLPINIEELIHGNTIEWERLEYKRGWNPEDIIHSMCAFANDLHNWGGGYIVVGIAEERGNPVFPPEGIQQNQLDRIQGEIIGLANRIQPNYFPITNPYVLQGQHILVIWCPAGDNRPYAAPSTLGTGGQRQCYVRIGSRSIVAQGENLRRLQELAARIPFDDRLNNRATLGDMDLGLIREYLQEIKSGLLEESAHLPFADLCRSMLIAKGPKEDIRPVNVGLLFFSNQPEQFFTRAWIELVLHKDDSGKNFKEVYFKGPLHKQVRKALSYIQSNIISEQVIKHSNQAESERFFNYPFEAIEEALVNAVYHKSYEHGSPVEIQIFPDRMTILSHPGPVPPVNRTVLSTAKRIIAREYRNRRIGDFLKELKLTEGRGTGFPSIYGALKANGSPAPSFETDDESYVLVTLFAKSSNQVSNQERIRVFSGIDEILEYCATDSKQGSNQVGNQVISVIEKDLGAHALNVLSYLKKNPHSSKEIFDNLGLSNQSKNRKNIFGPLLANKLIEYTVAENPKDPHQQYRITHLGLQLLILTDYN